ncbi:MAG: hypothetical protein ACW972_02465, partial [Promethearchaeota archaeon]
MPGTGHSSRHKGSITGRSSKSAFQTLAPWNSRKNGNVNQVAVSTGGGPLNFKLMNAKMMSNYDKNKDEFGNKTVNGTTKMIGDVDCCGNVTIAGKLTDLSNVDICGNLTIRGFLHAAGGAFITDLSVNKLTDVCDNILTLGNHTTVTKKHMRGIFMKVWNHEQNVGDHAFMGFDPSNACPYGPVPDDNYGQFLFLTGNTDLSFNPLSTAAECNITGGDLGRVAMGTLDISGSNRYGNGIGASGLPTQNVTGQQNSSMHLVGKTIIARNNQEPKPLDISGGITVQGNGPTTLGGTLEVTGDTTLGTLNAGASTLASAIVNGVTTLTGDATFGGSLLSATVGNAQNVFNTTTGAVTIGGGD